MAVSCARSLPTSPTQGRVVALEIHVDQPVHYVVPSRTVHLTAYAIDDNGAYHDVSERVAWLSTDADVLSVKHAVVPSATALAPGAAYVMASYEGLRDELMMTVRPWLELEESALRLQYFGTLPPGHSGVATAYLHREEKDVTAVARWTSSHPHVIAVDRGHLTALRPGTARITVSYGGHSDDCIVSVPPAAVSDRPGWNRDERLTP